MARPRVSVVIPAYNEAMSIDGVISGCKAFCHEIIVVDNGSTDGTAEIAKKSGAAVIRNERNLGITKATQKGLEDAHGDVIVTIDAEGQNDPEDIPNLTRPIMDGQGNVVLGVRDEIPHRSERIINALTNLGAKCADARTGFRAIRATTARKLKLHGTCLCGTFFLEARKRGARVVELPIKTKTRIHGKRKIKTQHISNSSTLHKT